MFEKILLGIVFIGILCAVSLIDIYKRIIPDSLLIIAVVFRIGYCVFVERIGAKAILGLLIDGLAISLPVFILVLLVEKIWKKEVLGGGDIKLLFVTGMYLGWEGNLLALFFACIIGIVIGLVQMKREEKDSYFPLGPAIALGAVCAMLIG